MVYDAVVFVLNKPRLVGWMNGAGFMNEMIHSKIVVCVSIKATDSTDSSCFSYLVRGV